MRQHRQLAIFKPRNTLVSLLDFEFNFIWFLACKVLWFVSIIVFQLFFKYKKLVIVWPCLSCWRTSCIVLAGESPLDAEQWFWQIYDSCMLCQRREKGTHLGCAKTLLKASLFQALENIPNLSLHWKNTRPLTCSWKRTFLTSSLWNKFRETRTKETVGYLA